jgi:phage head maturation protease
MAKTFILNDESVINSYGFRVLNAGINFDRFKENPVMLYNHEDDQVIGRWENWRVEGSQLKADAVFDSEDDEVKKIEGKVDRGFLKGASLGIHIESAEFMSMPGMDAVPAVTKSSVFEASVVGVPSNSLTLYSAKKERLSAEQVQLSIEKIIPKNPKPETMDKITLSAKVAGILKTATEVTAEVLNNAIETLHASLESATTEKKKAVDDLNVFLKARATALVEGAITEGRLTADKKETFLKMAETDFKQASDMIEMLPAKKTFSSQMKTGAPAGESREGWDYIKWAKEDPKGLAAMQAEKPEDFAALKASYKPKH